MVSKETEEEDTMNVTLKKMKATMNGYVSLDIIEEILSYLPCKSLLRFKVVCKQWKSLLHDRRFIDKHRHRNINHPSHFLDFDNFFDGTKMTLHMYEIGVDGYSYVKTVKTVSNLYEALLPSSYGLVCLYGLSNRKLAVINPNTEQIRNLQDYPEPFDYFEGSWPLNNPEMFARLYVNNLGFGFDPKSKGYKVVQLLRDLKTLGISKCYVLTVERFESHWREINDVSLDCKFGDLSFPVCVDGVIYWETESIIPGKRTHILTFDLRCEKIKMILAPKECMDNGFDLCGRHLVELQGNLCFVDVTCAIDELVHMDIWMMLKYSNDGHIGWASMYKLELGSWRTRSTIFPVIPLCIINAWKIILRGNKVMYCYNVEDESLNNYKWDGEDSDRHPPWLVHTETIVSLD